MQRTMHKRLGRKIRCITFAACAIAALAHGAPLGPALWARAAIADQPGRGQSRAEAVGERAVAWLAANNAPAAAQSRAAALWADLPKSANNTELLRRVALTFACGDSRAAALLERCAQPHDGRPLPARGWLMRDPPGKDDAFMLANLRLFYGRWLVRSALYDEAYELLRRSRPQDVVDADALLFFRAVACQRLLKTDEALADVQRLLGRRRDCPRRYRSLARLMEQDAQDLGPESLEHIARRMDDVRRRLDLGRPGEKTQTIENGIVESLDKLIEKLEQQQRSSSADAGSGGGSAQPSNPADDSRPMGGRGPGRVVRRDIGAKTGWGNLPAKQREEAMQQIGREFPAHYRDVIEQYFRELADQKQQASHETTPRD